MLTKVLLLLALPAAASLLDAARLADVPDVGEAVLVRDLALEKPMDFASSEIKGRIYLNRTVALTAVGGGILELEDGPVTLKYGKPTAWSFFTRERSVSLSTGRGVAVFPARSSGFASFGDFSTEADEGQPVVLKGGQKRTVLKESTRQARHSCRYAGVCHRTALDHNGQMTTGYGYSSTCSGTRKVLERVVAVRTDVSVELLLRGTAEAGAVIVAEPSFKEETSVAKELSGCG